jgi:hypothetical protein
VWRSRQCESSKDHPRGLQGRYDQAEPLFKRRLAVLEKAHGPNNPEATVLMSNLADVYIHRQAFKRSMAIRAKAGSGPI